MGPKQAGIRAVHRAGRGARRRAGASCAERPAAGGPRQVEPVRRPGWTVPAEAPRAAARRAPERPVALHPGPERPAVPLPRVGRRTAVAPGTGRATTRRPPATGHRAAAARVVGESAVDPRSVRRPGAGPPLAGPPVAGRVWPAVRGAVARGAHRADVRAAVMPGGSTQGRHAAGAWAARRAARWHPADGRAGRRWAPPGVPGSARPDGRARPTDPGKQPARDDRGRRTRWVVAGRTRADGADRAGAAVAGRRPAAGARRPRARRPGTAARPGRRRAR